MVETMIVGMMRIKNEARWIERVLTSMLPVCDRIFILDDHSTDETREICKRFPAVTLFDSPFEGIEETRDKNWLLEKVEQSCQAGTWVVAIDGDEEIAPGCCDEIRTLVKWAYGPDAYRFRVLYLWDTPEQIRVDGIYQRFHRGSMFKLTPGARFRSSAGGGFHCGNVPSPRSISDCGVRLLHYGYMYREDRLRKFEFYNAPDKQPIPPNEDGYRHMVIGDIFPADSRFLHAGPLQLTTL
jgi:glycosyltransferase involved in cell wall biosynthesis